MLAGVLSLVTYTTERLQSDDKLKNLLYEAVGKLKAKTRKLVLRDENLTDIDVDEEESQYNLDATDYWNLEDPTYACEFCGALFWYEESSSRSSDEFDATIVNELKSMLDECNCLAKSFRMARDRFVAEEYQDLKLRLLRKRGTDGRRYNLPTSSEVAALIVGDIEKNTVERDIVVETQTSLLQRIHELHPSYLPMQYPLLFPYGEDGYRDGIQIRGSESFSSKKRRRVTMREYIAFRIQDRAREAATILSSKRLFQQFVVDAYTMIQSERLSYIRSHQKNLRVELYKGLSEAFLRGETSASSLGKRTILPSSFTGDACYSLGLLDDDKEYIDGIKEASSWGSAHYLRRLFATMLFSNCLSRPEFIWDTIWHHLADDILHKQRTLLQHDTLQLKYDELKILTLAEIDKLLRSNEKSLAEFPPMPLPNEDLLFGARNKLLQDELCYDRNSMTIEHKTLMSSLTDEQKGVYETIISVVSKNEGGVFFLYGYGGTGKTFIWRTLSAAIRSKGQIVLNVASSGIASLLLPGGRTAHSRFGIPLAITEESTCNIKQGSDLAELLIHTKLIIWDEAPMAHRFCFEALDRTLRDILRFSNPSSCEQPFGGKVVVFGGDFRQILPIIPKGTRQDIIFATINSSYLWSFVKILTLTKNMRLETGSSNYNLEEMREFSKWILSVGDGDAGEENDGEEIIEIPDEFLIKESINPIVSIVDSTYPSLLSNIHDLQYLQERAILAPTLEIVDAVNEYMLSLIHGEEKVYLSSDSVCKTDVGLDGPEDVYTPDFLNSIKCSGVPNHMLKLKQGAPVMLLRNIDKSSGLCNGTRLVITQLGKHILEAKVISRSNIGENKQCGF
uniref:ATP-dependent DNA helicase n=1 Tax=Ananas comosus var. bracteatus TaxID=296719 RepID=A0A6V7NQF5_ANACO|nr:unnamed protein product [Ananas comosus var. bracteatus]